MNNKKRGRILIYAGTLLLLAAVSLVLYNRLSDSAAGEKAEKAVVQLKEQIGAAEPDIQDSSLQEPETPGEPGADSEAAQESEPDSTLDLDGELYIGILTVPKLGLELPVTYDWDYDKMSGALCRFSGSQQTGDLVICGHNYSAFLLDLDKLTEGDDVIFTSIDGRQHYYTVGWSELLSGWEAEKMVSQSDKWDLTLFTCTWSGYSRVTVRCIKAE